MKLDHLALGTTAFDRQSVFFTEVLGLAMLRTGKRFTTGTRIAMLGGTEAECKIELVEQLPDSDESEGLLHLAFEVNDIAHAYADLMSKGLETVLEPHPLPAANAISALLRETASGLHIQIIQYGTGQK